MRADANKIALRALGAIFDGARPFDVDIAGTRVACAVARAGAPPWPASAVDGLDAATDGPWPAPVSVECTWEGGKCSLTLLCDHVKGNGRYRHHIALKVLVRDRVTVVWTNLRAAIGDLEDGARVTIKGWGSTAKRKDLAAPGRAQVLNSALKALVTGSGLPLVTSGTVEICQIEIPSATVLPGPDVAFRRIVHLALFKIDFIDVGPDAVKRGRALVNVAELERAYANAPQPAESEDEMDAEAEDENEDASRERGYWAGGFQWGTGSKLDEFIAGAYWQVGWPQASTDPTAK
jgi:hypothetical protein